MRSPEELAACVWALYYTLNPDEHPNNVRKEKDSVEADDDLIDRDGYEQEGYFHLKDYTDSFYENLDQINHVLQQGVNDDGTIVDYQDAFARLCGSLCNLDQKLAEEDLPSRNLSQNASMDTYIAMAGIVQKHDFNVYGTTVALDTFEMACAVQPFLVQVALNHPENFNINNLVAEFHDNKDFYKAAIACLDEENNGIHISKNKKHVFYFHPEHERDIRYCGVAVKETKQCDGKESVSAHYYTPDWHGNQDSLTVSFIKDANERRPTRLPSGKYEKYLGSPQFQEQRDWLFGFYDKVNDVFGLPATLKPAPIPAATWALRPKF